MRYCQSILGSAVSLLALFSVVLAVPVCGHETAIPLLHPLEVPLKRISVADPTQETLDLTLGEALNREVKGGETHAFRILLTAGQFMQVSVEQQGINVILSLRTPDGKLLSEMDSPNNTLGPECISWIAESTGEIKLEVRSLDKAANPGRIVVQLEELRPALANDLNRVSAERVFMEANRLSDATPAELELRKIALGESRQNAITRFKEALPKWHAAKNTRGEAMTYYRIGQIYKQLGDYKKALENFDKGLTMQLESRDWRLTAGMLNDAGVVYDNQNEFDRALTFLGKAKQLFEEKGDRRGLASAHNNVAHVLGVMGKPSEALKELQRALLLRQLEHDRSGEINVLNNIGGTYNDLGDPHLALKHFSDALEIWRQLGNRSKIPIGLNNTAVMLEKLGDWQKAIDNYREALNLYRDIGDRSGEADALDNLGDMYESLGNPDQAREYYSQALHVAREFVGNKGTEANVLAHMARLQASEGKLDEALKSYNESLAIPQSKRRQAEALTGIGAVYVLKGNLPEALNYYEKALKLRTETEDPRGEAVTLDRLGRALFLSGNYEKAIESFNRAIEFWKRVEDQLGLASSLQGASLIQQERGNLTESLKLSIEAIDIVESLRTKVTSHQLRTSYFATKQNYYEHLISVYMDLYERDRKADSLASAFEASERSRARSLIDTLTAGRTGFAQNFNADLLRRRSEIQAKLQAKSGALTRMLNGAHSNDQLQQLRRDLAKLIAEDVQLWDQIKASHPNYAALIQPKPHTTREIQQLLDGETLLVEYALGDKRSYVWVVTPDSIKAVELSGRSQVEAAANRLVNALTARSRHQENENPQERLLRVSKAEADYPEAAAELSKLVIDPIASLLGSKRLVIVADGALQFVPFSALVIPQNEGIAQSRRPTGSPSASTKSSRVELISEHEVVTLPSASVLALQRRELAGRKRAPLAVAILADPVFDANDARVTKAKTNNSGNGGVAVQSQSPRIPETTASANFAQSEPLSEALRSIGGREISWLPFSRQEAEAIMKVAPKGETFAALGFKASRETAISPSLAKYRILHIATHGVMDLEHPELSGIVLSMVDDQGKPVDGYLRLHEIYNLDLPAELVVLSACQTGVGKQVKGEGLIALTRGFTYAGARRVVASYWKVDDKATSELMGEFYRQMFINKLKPAAALRAAQYQMSRGRRWHRPHYWAGFFIQGEWN